MLAMLVYWLTLPQSALITGALTGLLISSGGDLSLFALLTVGVFATELISNTAVTAKLAPILMGVALQAWVGNRQCGGARGLHVACRRTPPKNTLVHASGGGIQRDMMRAGLRLNLAAIIVITLLFYFGVAG